MLYFHLKTNYYTFHWQQQKKKDGVQQKKKEGEAPNKKDGVQPPVQVKRYENNKGTNLELQEWNGIISFTQKVLLATPCGDADMF